MINSCGRIFKNKRGISLIELTIFIMVAGIMSVGLIGAYTALVKGSTNPEIMVKANYLAQQKMEELTKYSFIDPNLGIQEQSYTSATIPNYQWYWKVEYIDGNSLAYSASATKYKKITIKLKDPGGKELNYYTIVTKRYVDAPEGQRY